MKAAVLRDGDSTLTVEEVEVSSVGDQEVLVRTAAAGLCHSDLHHLNGVFDIPRPTVLGHESSGIVEEVGKDVKELAPGDHVITCLATFCGTCDNCLAGRSYICKSVTSLRGEHEGFRLHQRGVQVHQFLNVSSFAEQVLVHESAAVRIDKRMPLDLACLIGCGVTTGLGAVINKAQVRPGQTVAVLGTGGVGLSAIQGAHISGASQIIAIDLNAEKLQVARELGATDVVVASQVDTVDAVHELTRGQGVDHSFEAVGHPVTATQSVEMLAVGGSATIVGLMPAGRMFPVQGRLLLDDRRVQGAYMGARNFKLAMPTYVNMYLDGRLRLEKMISSRITLDGLNESFEKMSRGESLRDVVVFAQDKPLPAS